MKLDQHFLIDEKVVSKIVEVSELKSKDVVLEIGFGNGMLTKELCKKCKVVAVELDEKLKINLDDCKIVYGDILKIFDKLEFNKVVSNIPYYISEPLFKKMLKLDFELAVLLVGKNFYDVLLDKSSKWNLVCGLFFDVKKILDVPKEAFDPKPRTESVVLKFKKRDKKLSKEEEIIKEFVLQDDKKVKNALVYSLVRVKGLTKKEAKDIVYKLVPLNLLEKNVDYLSNKQFIRVVEKIYKK